MVRYTMLLGFGTMLAGAVSAATATLAVDGQAKATLVQAGVPTLPEQTAVKELAAYLGKVTGATFAVTTEAKAPRAGVRVYVGPTAFAKRHGLDPAELGPEEWVMRTIGNDLVLAGGRPRGTMYAVYRFLEDVVGVRWWNPFEETVPSKPTLAIDKLDRRAKPVLAYRDIYMLYGNDSGRFAARNRLNRQGDAPIAAEYGGGMDYGPPYHVHTFYMYFPPKTYFKTHPEWYSLIGGKRNAERKQLCLTNPALRAASVKKLVAYIERSRAAANKSGRPAPRVFEISQNDWGGPCQCDTCQAIAKREGAESGVLLDFLNHIADAVKDTYPDVLIGTLAYQYTQKEPKTIKARDNLVIRLCDTTSNFTRPVTHPENKKFHDHVASWAKVAKHLRIWDYAVNYGNYSGLPMPTVHTYAPDYRFYAEHHVEGVFTEHEYPILADLRDVKIWMMIKLLEDPYRDPQALLVEFTDGFYGPAGKHVREYMAKLQAACDARGAYLSMGASPQRHSFLDLPFMRDAMALFDRAERAVAGNATRLRRVRFARLSLDRAAVVLFPKLIGEWTRTGGRPEAMPLNRDTMAARYKQTWYTAADRRIAPKQRAAEKARADAELAFQLVRPAHVPLPKRFRQLPGATVFDFTADQTRNWRNWVQRVPDPEAESAITNRLLLDDPSVLKHKKRYKLPMPWGIYEQKARRFGRTSQIKPTDVPGPGYHWYKIGPYKIVSSDYLYFFWSWIIQLDVDSVCDPKTPGQTFDVWARIKFAGPSFPHGKPGEKDAIYVERVVLVKSAAK